MWDTRCGARLGARYLAHGERAGPCHGREQRRRDLAFYVIVGSILVILAGLALKMADATDIFRNIEVIGWATVVFNAAAVGGRWIGMTIRRLEHMSTGSAPHRACRSRHIPASRSGGDNDRRASSWVRAGGGARFSLLLGIPAIAGAGVLGPDLSKWAIWLWARTRRSRLPVRLRPDRDRADDVVAPAGESPFILYRLALGGLIYGGPTLETEPT